MPRSTLCASPGRFEANDPRGVTFDDNGVPIYPDGKFDSIDNNDVTEKSWAGYLQANFEGDLGALPIRGNFGLRAIKTKVISNGFRGTLTATPAIGGGIHIDKQQRYAGTDQRRQLLH